MKRSVKVDIFGHDYILKSEAEEEHIHRVAGLVDRKMKEISINANSKSVLNIAILAAINIADEYLNIKDERERAEAKAKELTQFIDSKI